jgi:hypothetical protein
MKRLLKGRKGRSFIGYFIFSLFFFLTAIIVAYLVHDRTQVRPRPAAVSYCTVRGLGTIGWPCLDNTAEKAGPQALCPALPLSGRPICAGHSGLLEPFHSSAWRSLAGLH